MKIFLDLKLKWETINTLFYTHMKNYFRSGLDTTLRKCQCEILNCKRKNNGENNFEELFYL